LLNERIAINKKNILYMPFVISVLFFIGHKLSLYLALLYAAPIGNFAWTFTGGFIGGVIELEAYLFFTLFPLKLINDKNLLSSLRYIIKPFIVCFLLGGIIQGSYITGLQNLFYI
jgi:hypothetical protein